MLYIIKYFMKSLTTTAFTLVALLFGTPSWADLTVTRISVTGTEVTDPALVRAAFLEVAEGDTLDEARLDEVATLVRDRLVSLGTFDEVNVWVIRSKTNPGTAALVAEVTEGFPFRFGGGPYWGHFGVVNLGGRGHDLDLWLGTNRQAVGWTAHPGAPGWAGWTLGAEAGNRPLVWTASDGVRQEEHAVGASTSVSRDWGWGWTTGAALAADQVFDPVYTSSSPRVAPQGRVEWSRRAPGFSPVGPLVRVEATGVFPGPLARLGMDLRATFDLGAGFRAGFRGVGVVQRGEAPDREVLVATDLGLRRTFEPSRRDAVAWASAELRWRSPFDLGFITFEPALIADVGDGWATGGALRVYLGKPVSLPLQIEGTWDEEGRTWWGFSTTAPF